MADAADDVKARLRAQIAAIESGAGHPAPSSEGKGRSRRPLPREAPGPSPRDVSESLSGDALGSASCEAPDGLPVRRGSRGASGNLAGGRLPAFPSGTSGDLSDGAPPEPFDPSAEAERAFRKIERLCLAREQASEQLRRRLARDGFPPEAVEAAVGRSLSCGLVDDRRFADVLVRSRLAQGRGRRGIAAELEDLGIDADGFEALENGGGDDADEVERALALLERKPPRAKNRRDAAYRRLAQKGFGAAVASTAARLWSEAHED